MEMTERFSMTKISIKQWYAKLFLFSTREISAVDVVVVDDNRFEEHICFP